MKVVGWNGGVVLSEQAAVPVMDHGFLYGMTLFETMRTYGGRPFLLERHLKRLAEACGTLGIRYTLDVNQAERHIGEVMAANGLEEAYVRYTVSAGENGFGLPAGDYVAPLTLVLTKPLPSMPDMLYENGKPLQLLRTRRNVPEADIRYKSGHYMNNIVAKRELAACRSAEQGAEGLMLTADGKLAEGIVSNVFFVAGDRLCTPAIEAGILPGITRGFVMELAPACGLLPEEGMYTWDDLRQAEEIFITTSVQELVPITSLLDTDGKWVQVGQGRIGSYTDKLLQMYRAAAETVQ
ncbi:aminotransferase class IV [Paenibacillus sp. OSY-SE]|uniref:aminotransferase class IV n=1 Tax=Paenibacillus sp. OSY-SE TaxID=1196323 RepID=UPI0003167BDE|nr:aminotransferase class IV [Paenibacillus sp. OSY-SE]